MYKNPDNIVTEKASVFNQHLDLLFEIMEMASEGYSLSDSYAKASIEPNLCREGRQQCKFYRDIINKTHNEILHVGDRIIARSERKMAKETTGSKQRGISYV